MFIRASFQSLFYETGKVYTIYNPSPEEKASLNARFKRITQIGETYLLSDAEYQHLVFKVFVHNHWIERKFNIDSILEAHGLELSSSDVKTVCEALKNEQFVIHVHRDILTNTWTIPDQEQMLLAEKIKNILN